MNCQASYLDQLQETHKNMGPVDSIYIAQCVQVLEAVGAIGCTHVRFLLLKCTELGLSKVLELGTAMPLAVKQNDAPVANMSRRPIFTGTNLIAGQHKTVVRL